MHVYVFYGIYKTANITLLIFLAVSIPNFFYINVKW